MSRVRFYRNEPESAAKWMLDYLIRDQTKTRNIKIKVYIRSMKNTLGIVHDRSKTSYVIVLDPIMTRNQALRILAHEVVHVAQFITGKLKDKKSKGVYWKRHKVLKSDKEEDLISLAEYFALPWEVEAYKKQGRVARAYRKHLKSCPIHTSKSSSSAKT